jgi:hypothetical protein
MWLAQGIFKLTRMHARGSYIHGFSEVSSYTLKLLYILYFLCVF